MMVSLKTTKFYGICDKVAMVLLCVLMADTCIFGGGRILEVGPIGFKMAVLFLLLVAAIPQMLCNFKNILKNKFILMLAAFGIWLIFCAVRGLANENSLRILAADIKGFCYFAFLPAALCILRTKERIHTLMKVMMYAALALSIIHMAYLIIYVVSPKAFAFLLKFGIDKSLSLIGGVTKKIARIFFTSAMYLLCGFGFSLYFFIKEKEKPFKKIVIYPIIAGCSIFAIMIAYTRSVYFGAGVAALCSVLMYLIKTTAEIRKRLLCFLISMVAAFSVVTVAFNVSQKTDYFTLAITRTLVTFVDNDKISGMDEEDDDGSKEEMDYYLQATMNSDEIRRKTMKELTANIKKSPIIGHGLGKGLIVRENGEGFNEYFYLDLISKTGIIGLILYLLPIGYLTFMLLIKKIKDMEVPKIWLFALFGFLLYSYFNPYMNASLGILMYCCVITVFETYVNLKKEEK